MLKNKKNNFGGGKRIIMAAEDDILDFGEEFGTVRMTGSGAEVDGIINLNSGSKMTAEEAEEIDRQIRSQIEQDEKIKTFQRDFEARHAENKRAAAAGEKESAAQRFDRAMAEVRAESEAARQKRINLFGRDVPEPGEEMYNYYEKLQPEGQQNAARMRLEKIGIEPTEDNIRAEIRVGLKKENVDDDFATEWNQRARSQSVVNKDVTLRQSRQQAVEDEAAMHSERFKKLAAEREELNRKIAERNAAREAAEAKFEESIGPARAAREAEAVKRPTGQLRGTLMNPKTSGLTVGTPVETTAVEAAEDVAKNADLPKTTASQDIIDARISGEAPLNRSQIRALEDAYKAKGGDDLSLLKLMGDDGDNFFQEEMDKLASRKKRSSSYST